MLDLSVLTSFFGWMSVINIVFLGLAGSLLIVLNKSISKLHRNMFGITDSDVRKAYFNYLANYKIFVFVFNLVPYITLKIIN
ncbi:MAG: DUF6868 family protein [Pseudoalteromonas sp.]|uniref:DUF6868 family protein n=1 Tax=unclassified Pseudoalteromonas TaxID=194690 RepID=UPI003F9E7E08